MGESAGTIASLWRFPVKSMGGEQLEAAEVTETGLLGDRAYGLIDTETGKVVSGKSPRRWPEIMQCRATFIEQPGPGEEPPAVRITLPDSTTLTSADPDADEVLSGFLGHPVRVVRSSPEGFTIDQYHPDLEGLDPEGHRDTTVEAKLGSALFAELGFPSAVPLGSFLDLFPVSLITTSTLDGLTRLAPASRFDERRFRMNVTLATAGSGFAENEWVGRAIAIGDAVRLRVSIPDPRCVMTTLPQGDLTGDTDILRTLTRHNRLEVGGTGLRPCAGVYAVVESGGTMRVGDSVLVV